MNDIFLFNPTGEMAIANGTTSYMPPNKLRIFEDDLAFLPSFYAHDGDTIITSLQPNQEFLKKWHSLGLPILNYYQLSDLNTNTHFNCIKPWSWNQAIHHKLSILKENASNTFKKSPNYIWDNNHKTFYSRLTTNQIQEYISKKSYIDDNMVIETPAISLYSLNEFEIWMKSQSSVILKMPWSSSGRGIHIIDKNKNMPINYPWLKGAFKQQGFITAEPLLNKKFDFSFQLNLKSNGEIELLGISNFINDDKGHFTGGSIKWPHKKDKISSFLNHKLLNNISNHLIKAIKSVHPHRHYEGPLGVDAIVYENNNGDLLIHPCVDINWRYNMGMVNISLDKYLHNNSIGTWKVGSFKPEEWNKFIDQQQKEKPLVISGSKIISGFINMTPKNNNAYFGVWMEVWKQP